MMVIEWFFTIWLIEFFIHSFILFHSIRKESRPNWILFEIQHRPIKITYFSLLKTHTQKATFFGFLFQKKCFAEQKNQTITSKSSKLWKQVSKLALAKKKGRRELLQQALEHQSTHNTTQLAFVQSFSFQTFSPFYSSTHSQSVSHIIMHNANSS